MTEWVPCECDCDCSHTAPLEPPDEEAICDDCLMGDHPREDDE